MSAGLNQDEPASLRGQVMVSGAESQQMLRADSGVAPHAGAASCGSTRLSWDGRAACIVSQVGSPPVVMTFSILLLAVLMARLRAWMWAGIYVVLAIVLPVLYLVWLLHRGQVADLDVRRREQRFKPMVVMIVCGAAAWLLLALGSAPSQLVVLAGAALFQTAVIFVITLRWKISVHCSAASGAATIVFLLVGTPLPLLVGVPLVAWARIRLHQHTLAQTVAGTLLGAAIYLVALCLPLAW